MADTATTPYSILPNQAVEDYTDEDYKKALVFLASRWNIQTTSFALAGVAVGNSGSGTGAGTPSVEVSKGFARRFIEDIAYIYGSQQPSDYGFFVQDELGNNTRVPMFRGMDVAKYYFYLDGDLRDLFEPLPKMINVTAYSQDAVSVKKTMRDILKMKADRNSEIAEIQAISGVGLNPADINWDDDYEVKKHLENFQESMEVAYQSIAKHTALTNDYLKNIVKGGNYVYIGGMAMMEVYHHKGKIKWKLIRPECAVFDSTRSDDQHELDDYAGEVFEMTVPELLGAYEWTEKEIEDIKALANNINNAWGVYNTYIGLNGLYWWSQNNGVPRVTCVKGQWRSLEKKDGQWVEVLREGIYIGNKYLRDQKISDGQVWNKHDKSRKRLKYRIVTPNTMLGAVVGIVGMVKRFQDLKDALTTKMIGLTSSAIGKAYFVNANKLPEGFRTPDVISQLKQSNIVVVEGADIDDDESSKSQKMIESVDMTLDPSILGLLDLVRYYDSVIADILNIPAAARGQLTQYQSKDVVNSSLTQSTKGMKWYYGNIMLWVKGILEYSADLAKIMLPETQEGVDNLAVMVGDATVEMLSMDTIRQMQFEDFLLALIPNDIATEEDKKFLRDLAMQLASAGQFSMADAIKMKKLDTVSQLDDYFEYVEMKRQQREKEAQDNQLAVAQANAERNAQAQENIAAGQGDVKLASDQMKINAKQDEMAMQQAMPNQTS